MEKILYNNKKNVFFFTSESKNGSFLKFKSKNLAN